MLVVSDALGREVYHETLESRTIESTIILHTERWPSGIYVATLRGARNVVGSVRLMKE